MTRHANHPGIILSVGSANETFCYILLAEPIPRMIPASEWQKDEAKSCCPSLVTPNKNVDSFADASATKSMTTWWIFFVNASS